MHGRIGFNVNKAYLMHLNRECAYLDLSNLFTLEDVTYTRMFV